MIGAIAGDIIGSAYEFNPTNDYNFELFPLEAGFTDDTICTVAVADALLKGIEFGESIHSWCRNYPNPKGSYGGRFFSWVHSDNPQPYFSFGNGSAMRVSATGWWSDSIEEVMGLAIRSAECTHNHPEGIKGAVGVALAILLCRLKGKEQWRDSLKEAIKISGYAEEVENLDLERSRNKFDETCQGTVPVAFKILLESDSFEDSIRKAVSLGADADTLGAITGSIAEVIWGVPDWIESKTLSYLTPAMFNVLQEFKRARKS